jgi:hypothetical protein
VALAPLAVLAMAMKQHIAWDRPKLERFKKALEIERPGGRDHVFRFEGHDFLVCYAEYLVEYLEGVLK